MSESASTATGTPLNVDPQALVAPDDTGKLPLPAPEAAESGGSRFSLPTFAGGLANTEPNDPIEEMEGYRFGPEYVGKYLQRGVNKLTDSGTTAFEDFILAGISGLASAAGYFKGDDGDDDGRDGAASMPPPDR